MLYFYSFNSALYDITVAINDSAINRKVIFCFKNSADSVFDFVTCSVNMPVKVTAIFNIRFECHCSFISLS